MFVARWWIRNRPGALKWWGTFPVRSTWQVLHDLEEAFEEFVGSHEIHSQGRALPHLGALLGDPRYERVDHIAFFTHGGNLHLGPRSTYIHRTHAWGEDRALVHRVQEILWGAHRPMGTFLMRTWGWGLALALTAASTALLVGPSSTARTLTVAGATWVGILWCFGAGYVGLLARLRFDLPRASGSARHPGMLGTLLVSTVGTAVATLVASMITHLLGWTGQ